MPVSRGRKKKKKPTRKSRPVAAQALDELYEGEGFRLERRGKMTYLQNTRTEEEHQAYLDGLPAELDAINASITEGTNAIIAYFEAFDTIGLLGGLAINHHFNQTDRDDDGMAEIILEYGLNVGLAVRFIDRPLPKLSDIQELIINLENLKMVYHRRVIAESVNDHQLRPDEAHLTELRFQSVLEALSIRGNGYYVHVRELFLELFSGHDAFLLEHYGFTAGDLVATEKELEDAFRVRIGDLPGLPFGAPDLVFADWAFANGRLPVMNRESLAAFSATHPEYLVENGRIVTYSVGEVADFEPLFRVRFTKPVQEKVVRTLSLAFGGNSEYLLPPFNAHVLADTSARTHLFPRSADDRFYQFGVPLLSRNYLAIGQYLLENAPRDEKKYFKKYYQGNQQRVSRDRFLEDKVEKIFRSFLPDVRFIANSSYPLPKQKPNAKNLEYTELDLLGIGREHTYLIEVKAGELSAAGKRGAIDSLVSRLKKNISEGDYQSNRAQNYIIGNPAPVFKKGSELISVDRAKTIIRIVVTLDTFAGLLAGASVLENASLISSTNGYPWIVNIYDLMIFAELIASEEDFIDYLRLRLDLNRWKEFSSGDEINLLGHFFSDQLQFEEQERALDHFSLNIFCKRSTPTSMSVSGDSLAINLCEKNRLCISFQQE